MDTLKGHNNDKNDIRLQEKQYYKCLLDKFIGTTIYRPATPEKNSESAGILVDLTSDEPVIASRLKKEAFTPISPPKDNSDTKIFNDDVQVIETEGSDDFYEYKLRFRKGSSIFESDFLNELKKTINNAIENHMQQVAVTNEKVEQYRKSRRKPSEIQCNTSYEMSQKMDNKMKVTTGTPDKIDPVKHMKASKEKPIPTLENEMYQKQYEYIAGVKVNRLQENQITRSYKRFIDQMFSTSLYHPATPKKNPNPAEIQVELTGDEPVIARHLKKEAFTPISTHKDNSDKEIFNDLQVIETNTSDDFYKHKDEPVIARRLKKEAFMPISPPKDNCDEKIFNDVQVIETEGSDDFYEHKSKFRKVSSDLEDDWMKEFKKAINNAVENHMQKAAVTSKKIDRYLKKRNQKLENYNKIQSVEQMKPSKEKRLKPSKEKRLKPSKEKRLKVSKEKRLKAMPILENEMYQKKCEDMKVITDAPDKLDPIKQNKGAEEKSWKINRDCYQNLAVLLVDCRKGKIGEWKQSMTMPENEICQKKCEDLKAITGALDKLDPVKQEKAAEERHLKNSTGS